MRHSFRAHIVYLENTIQSVREHLTKRGLKVDEVEDLELQLTLAESALEHYHKAYALELTISSANPPHGPGADSSDAERDAKSGKGEKKKEGPPEARHTRKWARVALPFGISAARILHAMSGSVLDSIQSALTPQLAEPQLLLCSAHSINRAHYPFNRY
ncbi:MAG: hypothetical protein WBP85_03790 [Terracidiphilus sp.]